MLTWRRLCQLWRLAQASSAVGGLTLPREEHEAIHAKLDLLLEGQRTIMAQQDDLKAELKALATDIDTEIGSRAEAIAEALAAKADDTGIDLSSEITAVRDMRAKLGDMASVVAPAPADTGAGDVDPANPAAPAAPADGTTASS